MLYTRSKKKKSLKKSSENGVKTSTPVHHITRVKAKRGRGASKTKQARICTLPFTCASSQEVLLRHTDLSEHVSKVAQLVCGFNGRSVKCPITVGAD